MRTKNLLWTSLIILLLTSSILAVNVTFAAAAKMDVDPPLVEDIQVLNTFEVNITITNVNDLYAWEFGLSFNPVLLEVNSVTEGPFLKTVGDLFDGTFYRPRIQNAMGYVSALCLLLPDPDTSEFPPYGASGNGVLATIEFQVIGNGTCTLDLSDTVLETITGGQNNPIPHTAADGIFDNRVNRPPPTAVPDVTHPGMTKPVEGQPITFDGSLSSDDGWIVSYDWDFGDGTTDSGMVVDHIFSEIGTYTVGLTVTDNDGMTDTETVDVVVVEWMEGGGFPDILDAEPELYEWNEVAKGRELKLFGTVGNPTNVTYEVYVKFTIHHTDDGSLLGSITSDTVTIAGGETLQLDATMDLRDTSWRVMRPHASYWAQARLASNKRYTVFAACYYRLASPGDFEKGFATQDFSFKVKGAVHDIAILDLTTNATNGAIQEGDVLGIYVTIDNEGGNYDEIFDITVQYKGLINSSIVEVRTVELKQQESRVESFALDTSGLNLGAYKIIVNLTILTYEEDTGDNKVDCLISVVA